MNEGGVGAEKPGPRQGCRTFALAASAAQLLAPAAWLGWELARLRIEVAFAEEQTAIFEAMHARAVRSDAAEAAGCLGGRLPNSFTTSMFFRSRTTILNDVSPEGSTRPVTRTIFPVTSSDHPRASALSNRFAVNLPPSLS
jgi:hypothetical protein